MRSLTCPECGAENEPGTLVCAECGSALGDLNKPIAEGSAGIAQPAEELPDWLDELRAAGEKGATSGKEDAILPDWLVEAAGEEKVTEETPDWLAPDKKGRDRQAKEKPSTTGEADFPDWGEIAEDAEIAELLSALEQNQKVPGLEWETAETPGEALDADLTEAIEPGISSISWLEALERAEQDTAATERPVGAERTAAPVEPEWPEPEAERGVPELSSAREAPAEEPAAAEAFGGELVADETAGLFEEHLAGWLAESEPADKATEAGPSLEPAEEELAPEKESQEWFEALEAGMATGFVFADVGREGEPPSEQAEEELPDWISEVRQQEEWPEEKLEQESFEEWVASQTGELKDDQVRQEPKPKLGDTKPLRPSKELKGVPEQIAGEQLPDWLADQIQEEPPVEEIEGLPPSELRESLPPSELPEWLAGMALAQAVAAEEEAVESEQAVPETAEEWQGLMDDLSAAQQGEVIEEAEPGEIHEADLPLGPTAMPEWLEALRPYRPDQPVTTELDAPLESRGPLAGLRGVIQIEPIVAEPHRSGRIPEAPPAPDLSQEMAVLRRLTRPEKVIEGKPEHIGEGPVSDLPRVLLGLALLAAVLVGWLVPSLRDSLPPLTSPALSTSAGSAFAALEQAGTGRVLVAFDYSPASAGELDAVAETFLSQLAANGAAVITLSQVPTGLPIAERMSAQVEGLEVQSLGYVPGEAQGLRGLASCLDGNSGCETAYGRMVDGDLADALQEVGLVLILTEERDYLLNWIEQVQATTGLPLVSGTTQTLGPVTAPYFGSGQLAGAVIGVPDASAYEQDLLAQEGNASNLAANLGLAQWLVIVSLVAGGLYYGLAGFSPTTGDKRGAR